MVKSIFFIKAFSPQSISILNMQSYYVFSNTTDDCQVLSLLFLNLRTLDLSVFCQYAKNSYVHKLLSKIKLLHESLYKTNTAYNTKHNLHSSSNFKTVSKLYVLLIFQHGLCKIVLK